MTFPAGLTLVTVHGRADFPPSGGASGQARFERPVTLVGGADNSIVPPRPEYAVLDAAGEFTISLPATNDPDWTPQGWAYAVEITTTGGVIRGTLQLDYQTAAVELADLLQVDGTAVAGTSYIPLSARGLAGGVAGLDVDGDVNDAAGNKITSGAGNGVTLPASNGADDTAALNAALTTGAGERILGLQGEAYLVTAPLVVHSGTTLDMTGCTVTLKTNSNSNLLNNRAVSQVRRVVDAVTTAASQTITSATAAFTAGDIGKTLVVHGAGAGGALLTTTVSAVTNGTTATMTAAATTSTTGTYTAIGTRDANITIRGGTWIRLTSNNGSANGWDKHSLRFRHVDGLLLQDVTISTLEGKYAVSLGDVSDAKVRDVTLAAFSDGIHIQGPAFRTHVAQIRGSTGDDSVAVTPRDWTAYDDVFGHVEDTLIQDVTCSSTAACAIKVLGGSTATAARRTVVERIAGSAVNHAMIIGDDTAQANTTGGLVSDIAIRDVRTTTANAKNLILLNGRSMSRLRISEIEFSNASGSVPIISYAPTATATLDSLVVTEARVATMGGVPLVRVDLLATVSRMRISGVDIGATATGANVVHNRALITDLIVRDVTAALTGSSNVVALSDSESAAAVTRMTMSGLHFTGTGGAAIRAAVAGHTLPRVEMSDVEMSGVGWIADLATVTELHLANITTLSPGSGLMNVRATAAVVISGAGLNLALGGSNINVAGGGTVTSKTLALQCDVDDLQLTANSLAYNTNAAKAFGVGPVVSNGTAWKHLYAAPAVVVKRAIVSSGNITPQNTAGAWAALTGGPTLALAAAVGDYLSVEIMGLLMTKDNATFWDLGIVVGGSVVRFGSSGTGTPATEGDPAFYPDTAYPRAGTVMDFVAASGDISGGTVTACFAVKSGGAGQLHAGFYPLRWRIVNHGAVTVS